MAILLELCRQPQGADLPGPGSVGGVYAAEHGALPLYLAGGPGPDRRGTGLDPGTGHHPVRLGWPLRLRWGAFCCTSRAHVHPPGGLPHRVQHPQAGGGHMMQAPWLFRHQRLGLIRGRLDAAAADTETLLAHNLADIVGTSRCSSPCW